MKQVFLFFFLVAIAMAYAVPLKIEKLAEPAKILRSSFDMDPTGSYNFGFENDNSIVRDETGELKTIKNAEGKDENVMVVRGSYSYIDANGKPITVVYFADETGFHPEGEHLPKI